jgi:serine/threonine-protein kinase
MADSGAAIGEILNNCYEVMERLSDGACFQTFKARDHVQNRMVALKLLRNEFGAQKTMRDRVTAEGNAVKELIHPNIARVYESVSTETTAYVASEYVRGMNLKERLRRAASFPLAVAVDIAIVIAEALEFAHERGIAHGDLRAQNILISVEGQVKVTDFGLGRVLTSSEGERFPSLRRVPYMSPEVAEGKPPTPASDIYSLGVILYEMLTAILPFEGDTSISVALKLARDPAVSPSRINTGVPPALDGIVLKAMQKDPARRYRSIGAMLKDLRAAQEALRFGKSLNWTPKDSRIAEIEEEEEIPPAVSAISTINKVLLAVVVIGLGTVGMLIWTLLFRSNPDVHVPALVGMYRTTALQQIDEIGLKPHVNEEYNSKYAEGQVFKIYPLAGTGVKPGGDISVWISKARSRWRSPT